MAVGAFGAQSGSGSFGAAAATGDPHLQNVFGERFDLMRPGNHVLIHIPRGERVENALLRVEAVARRLGGQCTDMYFQEINVTGDWVEKKYHRGGVGLRFQARHVRDETTSESYPWAHTAGHPLFEFSRQKSWACRVCCR